MAKPIQYCKVKKLNKKNYYLENRKKKKKKESAWEDVGRLYSNSTPFYTGNLRTLVSTGVLKLTSQGYLGIAGLTVH